MHRFFITDKEFRGDGVVLTGRQAHQISNVLRMSAGDHIVVLDNRGSEYEVGLTKIARAEVVGEVVEKRKAAGEPAVSITLYQSLLRQDKFRYVLQKCTEAGVKHFAPIIAQRSIIHDPEVVSPNRLTRWVRIVAEAAEQSQRGRIPQLSPPVTLEKAVAGLGRFGRSLIASPYEETPSLHSSLEVCRDKTSVSVALFVGPEGGFTEEEVQLVCEKGAVGVSLGPRILRSETAAVVASSLILYELGELL